MHRSVLDDLLTASDADRPSEAIFRHASPADIAQNGHSAMRLRPLIIGCLDAFVASKTDPQRTAHLHGVRPFTRLGRQDRGVPRWVAKQQQVEGEPPPRRVDVIQLLAARSKASKVARESPELWAEPGDVA